MKSEPIKFFTEAEVARRYRITRPTIRKMRDEGKIDFIRVGKSIRYPEHVIEGILKKEA